MEHVVFLAYLDHNVLDLMTKGDPHNVKKFLKEVPLTPIFSNETLSEIHRSRGYEHKFLEVLEEINAKYIEPILDHKFKQTGQARVHNVAPKSIYEQFLQNKSEAPNGDFGLSEMLMKFYGGNKESSFGEILKNGTGELQNYLSDTLKNLDDAPEIGPHFREILKNSVADLPEIVEYQTSSMAAKLDRQDASPISAFEKETGIGPKILNNITPPNVVSKIWDILSEKIDSTNLDLDTFFGVKPHAFEEDFDRERTLQEKVNAVYHQLNFLGYYRDSKMKKERRFRASFSDMTHAGIASFCHVFLCRDKSLVMKAAAAFEHLGVKTKILHYQANKSLNPTA